MAKSLRSKWRRKCRAVKRERYGKKELERLKKTLGVDGTKTEEAPAAEEIVNIVDKTQITVKAVEADKMETDEKAFSTKTLRDQHGSYPVWLHPRKIIKKKKNAKKGKKGKNKKRNHQ